MSALGNCGGWRRLVLVSLAMFSMGAQALVAGDDHVVTTGGETVINASGADLPGGVRAPLVVTANPFFISVFGNTVLSTTGGSGTGAVSYAITAGGTFCRLVTNVQTGLLNVVNGTATGNCTVTATKAASPGFAAETATVNVPVSLAFQGNLFATATPSTIAIGGTSTLSTTGGSGTGAVTYAITTGNTFCSLAGNTVTGTANGSCTITATKAADAQYSAISSAPVTITVGQTNQAPLTVTAAPSSIPVGGTSALSTSGGSGTGAVSYAITSGNAFCSVSGSTLTGVAAGGVCTVTATKAASGAFGSATATTAVTIRANQVGFTAVATPSTIPINGTSSLSTTGGSGTGTVGYQLVTGLQSCTLSGSTITGIAAGTCDVQAFKAGDGNFNVAFSNVIVTVGSSSQAPLTVTASPPSITLGGTSILSATGGSGTGAVSYAITAGNAFCSVSGNTLSGTGVGSCTVTATKAGSGSFGPISATTTVTVNRADQATLSVNATPANITVGGSSALSTTGGSGTGAVSYAISAGASFCSLSGTTVTGTANGSCTVTATKAADANFNATTATRVISVGLANQAPLTVTANPSFIFFGETSALSTTGGSGTGAVSYAITAGGSFCSIAGSTLSGTGVGTCTVLATKSGSGSFGPATATTTVTVDRAPGVPLVLNVSPANITAGGSSILSTTGGSGTGAVSYAIYVGANFCSLSGNTVTGTASGTCTIIATKAADANFLATSAFNDVTVGLANQAPLTVIANPSSVSVGGTSALSTTGGSGSGAVSYAITAGGSFCSVSGSTLSGTGVGSCTVTATKAGNASFGPATATTTVTVNRANQAALTLNATPASITVGGTSALSTTGGSGTGAVSYAITAGAASCSLSGSTVTATASGSCTITATKAADANFNATTATRLISVVPASGADLQVAKSAPVTQAEPGSTVVYTIIVSNVGPSGATGATLASNPPGTLGNVVWQCVPGGSTANCPSAGGSGTGPLSAVVNLPAGTHLRYDFSARILAKEGAMISSSATVTPPVGLTDPNTGNNSSTHQILVISSGPIFRNGFENPAPPIEPEAAAAALRSALDL